MSEYLAEYGYPVVALWALLEGETVLLLAGFAAQQGKLDLGVILGIGWIGAFLGDQFWFHVARRYGSGWLDRRPHLIAKTATAKRLLERHSTLFIFSFRFIYGMRNLGAMVIGLSSVTSWRFAWLNLAAAAVWSVAVIMSGYLFGEAAMALLDELAGFEKIALAAVLIIAVAVVGSLVLRRWLLRRLS